MVDVRNTEHLRVNIPFPRGKKSRRSVPEEELFFLNQCHAVFFRIYEGITASRLVKFSGKNGKHAAARCAFLMSVDKGESGKMLAG